MIGKDFKAISNSEGIVKFCKKYSSSEIKIFLTSYCGGALGNRNKGCNKPCTKGTIPDIRRIYGAGLKVLSGSCDNISEDVKFYADIVFNTVKKSKFAVYDVIDGILTYKCLTY